MNKKVLAKLVDKDTLKKFYEELVEEEKERQRIKEQEQIEKEQAKLETEVLEMLSSFDSIKEMFNDYFNTQVFHHYNEFKMIKEYDLVIYEDLINEFGILKDLVEERLKSITKKFVSD